METFEFDQQASLKHGTVEETMFIFCYNRIRMLIACLHNFPL